jgi:hypothetical protein
MKSQLLRISVKFGLILGGVNLIIGLISTLTFNPEKLSQVSSVITGIISLGLMITLLAIAHYKFNKKNEDFLSFKDAILIGLLILGISYIISTLYSFFSYEFIMKEKMHLFYSNLSAKNGTEINENLFSTGKIILLSIVGLLTQILFLFVLITFESQWKIFKKAGKEGWASIVPIYNIIVLLEIVKKPVWWLVFLLIPFVNIVFAIWMTNLLSKRFGKDEGFTIGLIFLPFIFYPLLGMSKVKYSDE